MWDELGFPAPDAPVQNTGRSKGGAATLAHPLRQSEPGGVDRKAFGLVDDAQSGSETDNFYVPAAPQCGVGEHAGYPLNCGSSVLARSKNLAEVFAVRLESLKKLGRFRDPQRNRSGQQAEQDGQALEQHQPSSLSHVFSELEPRTIARGEGIAEPAEFAACRAVRNSGKAVIERLAELCFDVRSKRGNTCRERQFADGEVYQRREDRRERNTWRGGAGALFFRRRIFGQALEDLPRRGRPQIVTWIEPAFHPPEPPGLFPMSGPPTRDAGRTLHLSSRLRYSASVTACWLRNSLRSLCRDSASEKHPWECRSTVRPGATTVPGQSYGMGGNAHYGLGHPGVGLWNTHQSTRKPA